MTAPASKALFEGYILCTVLPRRGIVYRRGDSSPRNAAPEDILFQCGLSPVWKMNDRAASRGVSKIATPKNDAANCGVIIIPRKRDKNAPENIRRVLYKRWLFPCAESAA
jgi:hypothetical protein